MRFCQRLKSKENQGPLIRLFLCAQTLYRALHPLADGILFRHYSEVPPGWWPWKNFTARELACRRTGQIYYHPRTIEALQKSRDYLGRAHYVGSGHRSRLHNTAVGGAPKSAHRMLACDISSHNHDRLELYLSLKAAGFSSFGFYVNFIHADLRPGRRWYGNQQAKKIWLPIFDRIRTADMSL